MHGFTFTADYCSQPKDGFYSQTIMSCTNMAITLFFYTDNEIKFNMVVTEILTEKPRELYMGKSHTNSHVKT